MRRFCDALEQILRLLLAVLVLSMLAVLAGQVFMRYVFDEPLSWSEELVLLGFAWMIVFASAIAVRRMEHVRMDLLIGALRPMPRRILERILSAAIMAFGLYLAYSGWVYVAETRGAVSAAIAYPIELLYGAAPCFGMLVAVFSLERLLAAGSRDV